MRKSFSGDRDTAFEYLGAAQTQLMILKNMMRLGGLSQMSRIVNFPGGVVVQVACVFGQEYVSIHAPSVPITVQKTIDMPSRVEEVVNVYEQDEIDSFVNSTFADVVRSTGSGSLTITRPGTSTWKAYIPGVKFVASVPGGVVPMYYSTAGGAVTLKSPPVGGGAARIISADGVAVAGQVRRNGSWAIQSQDANLPAYWKTPTSSPVVLPDAFSGGRVISISDDRRYVLFSNIYTGFTAEWDTNNNITSYAIKGRYTPWNAAASFKSGNQYDVTSSAGSTTISFPSSDYQPAIGASGNGPAVLTGSAAVPAASTIFF